MYIAFEFYKSLKTQLMPTQERKIYTLTGLTTSLEKLFLQKFATQSYWITAEVVKVNEKGGHRYFELADSNEQGTLTSKIQASMWKSSFDNVNNTINGELPKVLSHGNKVLLEVKIEYHQIYGLKLNIIDVDPSITYGEIERKKKETIDKLKKEGLFFNQAKLYLSPIIKRIALIGSPNTSGHRDFLDELFSNEIFRNFKVKEFPCSVQGEKAKAEILSQISEAKQYNVDVIVILRGGGSKMDLNVFNDYEICKEICLSPIPVMTGIGHESDEVVADLVCRMPHITPTAIAKHFYTSIGVFSGHLRSSFDSIIRQAMELLFGEKEEFNHLYKYFNYYSTALINESKKKLTQEVHNLQLVTTDIIQNEKSALSLNLNKMYNYSINKIELAKTTFLDAQLEKISLLSSRDVEQANITLQNLQEKLDLLNPTSLLKRGYTITTLDNIDLNQTQGELKGKEIKILTDKNIITGTINKVEKNG